MDTELILQQAKALVAAEGEAVAAVADQLGPTFVAAVRLVSECTGVIMTTGSGTSGTMARRMAHIFATCGMHAFFVHPADALHGPSAAVTPGDVLIALSKAGKSRDQRLRPRRQGAGRQGYQPDLGAGVTAGQAERCRAGDSARCAQRGRGGAPLWQHTRQRRRGRCTLPGGQEPAGLRPGHIDANASLRRDGGVGSEIDRDSLSECL